MQRALSDNEYKKFRSLACSYEDTLCFDDIGCIRYRTMLLDLHDDCGTAKFNQYYSQSYKAFANHVLNFIVDTRDNLMAL